jgi:hypothetical protein
MTMIELGQLAECLLYYRQVHLVVNPQRLNFLVQACGADLLFNLMDEGMLNLIYQEDLLGTQKLDRDPEVGPYRFLSVEGHKFRAERFVPEMFQSLTGKSGKGRRLGAQLLRRMTIRKYPKERVDDWLADFGDGDYTDRVAGELLRLLVPTYQQPEKIIFRAHPQAIKGEFIAETNLNFRAVNEIFCKTGADFEINRPYILACLFEGTANFMLAADTASEVLASPFESILIRHRLGRVIDRSSKAAETKEKFHECTLESKSIADAIITGQKNFHDLKNCWMRQFDLGNGSMTAPTMKIWCKNMSKLAVTSRGPKKCPTKN